MNFTPISISSLEDGDQNDKIEELIIKVDLIAQKLGIEFVEKYVEEEYKDFWGRKKKRMATTLEAVDKL